MHSKIILALSDISVWMRNLKKRFERKMQFSNVRINVDTALVSMQTSLKRFVPFRQGDLNKNTSYMKFWSPLIGFSLFKALLNR